MKNVYFVQPSNTLLGSIYLPYSAGTIAAYSWQFEEIKSAYNLSGFIIIQEDISEVVSRLDNPYLVGFSCYIWNTEYNLSLAKEIKKAFPDCIIVFGGPDVPESTDYLEKYDFVDILMFSEGEITFKNLFDALENTSPLETVSNICFRKDGIPFITESELPGDIFDFPSPYTSGIFDSIVNNPKYAGMQFDVIFETNRGCPHSCIFCYWGRNKSKFRIFPMEKVKAEIDWFVKHKVSYCFLADANFGILERDEEITDYLINSRKLYGYPARIESFAAKDKTDRVFNINKKLALADMNNGVSVACQSLSPEVLNNIERQNMSIEELKAVFRRYSEENIYTYTDLIMCLPGDTYEGFCRSLTGVIEAGQHSSINVLPFELLPNTTIYTPEFIEKYSVKTVKNKICINRCKKQDIASLGSRSEVIVETNTMSRADWKNAYRLSVLVQGFHCLNLITYIAVYLRREKNVSYYDFYTSLYEWSESSKTFIKSVTDKVCACFDDFIEGKGYLGFSCEELGDIYWPFSEAQFIFAILEHDRFFAEIKEFTKRFNPDKDEFEDLLLYQQKMLVPKERNEETVEFKYRWDEYFSDICDTEVKGPRRQPLRIRFNEKKFSDVYDYSYNIVWKGKRQKKMLAPDAEIL